MNRKNPHRRAALGRGHQPPGDHRRHRAGSAGRGHPHGRQATERPPYGITRARNHGIPTTVVDHRGHASREAYDRVLVDHLKDHGVELVVLAGFMRLLSPFFIQSFPDRIMNIHPALSPSFAGLHGQKTGLRIRSAVSPAAPSTS